jgi:hypothetical protein
MAKQPTAEIFIDFEGNKGKTPTLLGVLERTTNFEIFHQYILEDIFAVLSPSEKHPRLLVNSLDNILKDLDTRHGANAIVYAWSTHEQTVIDELLSDADLSSQWTDRIIDAKKLAQRWAKVTFPNHQFKKTERRGRHTLDQYLDLIKYKVPAVHGAGKTGKRLRSLRETLIKGQPFESWPTSKKKYWTNLLAHNKHDCYGMMAIIDRISADSTD